MTEQWQEETPNPQISEPCSIQPELTATESTRQARRDLWLSEELPNKDPSLTLPSDSMNLSLDLSFTESGFKVGIFEDKNKRHRRTMEDTHCFVDCFNDEKGAGFFGVFDGHAGKVCADWCGQHLQENVQKLILENPEKPVPEILNEAFKITDHQISEMRHQFSGCTAVVALIRWESRVNQDGSMRKVRVLYVANAGDARAVLERDKKAIRLSYDHKGSDADEARRIVESGGFVISGRVNGVLAVTRSLGDISMKEWVIGNPYTTETELDSNDSKLILACDGLWDVCSDQEPFDHIRELQDPQTAAQELVQFALVKGSNDNLTVMVIVLNPTFEIK